MMKKLLLADDSITIQKVVGIIFSTEEYQLEMTDDGNSAFDKALADVPDLVIADISMPGKDGFELCRAIKSEPGLSNTSVLLLPGAFDHFDELKAGEVCADGWLTKPFESQALLDKVSQLLEAEPVRMAGVVAPAAEEVPAGSQEDDAIATDSSVDEESLGFDEAEELEMSAGEGEDESPDDIWDAVSFAEEDLQDSNVASNVDSEDEVSFAADIIDPSAVDAAATELATDEEVVSAFTDETDDDSAVAEVESDFDEEDSEITPVEAFQPESFEESSAAVEESISELNDQMESDPQVDSSVPAEEPEVVDFSAFSDAEDDYQETTVEAREEPTDFVSVVEDEEPLELVDELDDPVEAAEEPSFFVAESEENEPLELAESDLAEQNAETDVADEESVSFVAEPDDEDILELQEEDEQVDLESVLPEVATEESAVSFTETADDNLSENDEILDLSVDEIIAEEPVEEETAEEVVEEPAAEEIEPFVAEATEFGSDQDVEPESEPVDDIVDLAEEETELVEEAETLSAVAEDEDFYFDATAEDDDGVADAVTAGAVGIAAGVAATNFGADESEDSTTEQVEQQLRELSEDELRDVVSKVAGPMIEKLAGEMLEKVAWEVVPDLAEAMISEEIRKIKEGA